MKREYYKNYGWGRHPGDEAATTTSPPPTGTCVATSRAERPAHTLGGQTTPPIRTTGGAANDDGNMR